MTSLPSAGSGSIESFGLVSALPRTAVPTPSGANWRAVAFVVAGIAITSAGHYLTPPEQRLWHGIFQRLYYLPVVYAAIAFGWTGGLVAATTAAALYVPHILTTWHHQHEYAMEQYAEICMFFAVGLVTGILADRERKRRAELQATTEQLRAVYQELQNTFERVKRIDRLSAVGQLAAGLAHEIRNPMASIDGAAELLETADDRPELRRETVGIIRKECARLNRLLTGLLDFARPRNPERGEVDVAKVLDTVIELVQHSASRGLVFQKRLPQEFVRVEGDREQLTQVVLNLALNAAQATTEGGVVSFAAQNEPGGVTILVEDEGVGVPERDLDRIFDPFFTTKDTGTGLGLSVAHQIVTQHGGTVTASRNPTKGMTFRLFLPNKRGGRE